MLQAKVNGRRLMGARLESVGASGDEGAREPVFLLTLMRHRETEAFSRLRDDGKQDLFVAGDDDRFYLIQSRTLQLEGGGSPKKGDRVEVSDDVKGGFRMVGTVMYADQEKDIVARLAPKLAAVGVSCAASLLALAAGSASPLAPVLWTATLVGVVGSAASAVREDARTRRNGAPGAIFPYVASGGVRLL